MQKTLILIVSIMFLQAAACRSTALNENVPVSIDAEIVYRGAFCNAPEEGPSAELVLDDADLSLVYARLNRHVIGKPVNMPPDIDLSADLLLMVYRGRVPTSGYSIDLADGTVRVSDGTAEVRIAFRDPPEGSVLAQVVSSPCALIKLPAAGYHSIILKDRDGRVLLKRRLTVR